MTKNVLIKGHFVKTVFFCKMVQFLVCYPCAATLEINCFYCTQPRGKRMKHDANQVKLQAWKKCASFLSGLIFLITRTFFSLESAFTTMHKLGKVTKGSIKCHEAVFLANFWRSTWAKLLFFVSKCSLKLLKTWQISQKLFKLR